MSGKQQGFGIFQFLLALVAVVGVTVVAVPKYQDFVVRSKMSEAFAVIGDTKTKLTEFYVMKHRFPKSQRELDSVKTEMFSPPEFVDKVEVKSVTEEGDVVIQVYFQPEVIPGDSFNDQFLYVAGSSHDGVNAMVQWSCGLKGIDEKYMPARCLD